MMAHLIWNASKRTEVRTISELDRIVDQLIKEAEESHSFTVELSVNNKTSMVIVLGREVSHAEFYDSTSRPPVFSSRGLSDDDEPIVFFHHGHYSEVPRKYWIPSEDAREGLRCYFRTGSMPENLHWE